LPPFILDSINTTADCFSKKKFADIVQTIEGHACQTVHHAPIQKISHSAAGPGTINYESCFIRAAISFHHTETIMPDSEMKITAYLATHFSLRLVTPTCRKTPQVHTVGSVSEDCTVYFVTDRKSREAGNIPHQPAVAYAIDMNYQDVMIMQGVQMDDRTSPVVFGHRDMVDFP